MRRLFMAAAIGVLCFAGRLAWNLISVQPLPEPTAADLAAQIAERDAEIAEELASGGSAPARGWLDAPEHVLFEGDPDSVDALIESLYQAGAVDVRFTFIEEFAGKLVSASIAVELPDDAGARSRLLQAQADYWQETEPEPDVGQRYLEFAFD